MLKQFNVIYDIAQVREQCATIMRYADSTQIDPLLLAWLSRTLADLHALPMDRMRIHPTVKEELRNYPDLRSVESTLYQATPIPWDRLQIPANFNCSIAVIRDDLILTFM